MKTPQILKHSSDAVIYPVDYAVYQRNDKNGAVIPVVLNEDVSSLGIKVYIKNRLVEEFNNVKFKSNDRIIEARITIAVGGWYKNTYSTIPLAGDSIETVNLVQYFTFTTNYTGTTTKCFALRHPNRTGGMVFADGHVAGQNFTGISGLNAKLRIQSGGLNILCY
jgi:prepilin-type processing-associated H-X9-DG protein